MKTYTGKCPIYRGNGDLICKGINTLNILDISFHDGDPVTHVKPLYLRCVMTVGAQVSHPHHSDLLPISVYEAVAFLLPCLLLPETGRLTGVTLWCTDCRQQMDGFLSYYLDDALFPKLLFVGSGVAPLRREVIRDCRGSCFYLIPFTRHSNETSSPPIENSDVSLNSCCLSVQHNNQHFP